MTERKRLGFMYVAKRRCGKVSAMSWDDPGSEKENAKSVASWIRLGHAVERIERFEGDPMPEWCSGCEACGPAAKGVVAQLEQVAK